MPGNATGEVMPRQKKKPDHIVQEDWDAVDSPPLTERMLRNMKPASESMPPHLYEKLVRAYKERRARADREAFLRILNREDGAEPEAEDALPGNEAAGR
jgi:hypothetical protein